MSKPSGSLPPEVLELLRQGRTVEAIKLLRGTTLGLRDAMQIIDAYKRGVPASTDARVTPGSLPPDVKEALERGNKIEAIKRYRVQAQVGLKEAKDAVDNAQLMTNAKPAGPGGYSPGEVPRSQNFGWVLVVIVIAALGGYYFLRG
jgi:ribosomal protein L7/L12